MEILIRIRGSVAEFRRSGGGTNLKERVLLLALELVRAEDL